MIDSSALLDGICGLRGLWLLSDMIVSPFSSCVLPAIAPVWILLGALPLVGDLLLEFCLFGGSDGVNNGPVELVFGLPLWLPLIIAADSAGVTPKVTCSLIDFSFVDGTK